MLVIKKFFSLEEGIEDYIKNFLIKDDLMYEHNLKPIAVEFLNIKVYWYSISIYPLDFFFLYLLFKIFNNKKLLNLKIDIIDDFITWSILAILIGGKLGYVIFYNFDFYFHNPFEIVKIWKGGMSFHDWFNWNLNSNAYLFKIKKN